MKEVLNVEEFLKKQKAIWFYKGKPGEPHAILEKGFHSDGFINLLKVLAQTSLAEILTIQLFRKIREKLQNEKIGALVSTCGGSVFFKFASLLSLKFNKELITVIIPADPEKSFWKQFLPELAKRKVLIYEDFLPTMKRVKFLQSKLSGIEFMKKEGKILVTCLVFSGIKRPAEYEIISLLEKEIHYFSPQNCPLCARGSKPLNPEDNWSEFEKFI